MTASDSQARFVLARQRLVDGFAGLRSFTDLAGHPLLDALEAQALYAHDSFVRVLNGSAPGDASASAGSPPSAGTPRLVSVATGADTTSVSSGHVFACEPDPSCGQDGAA